jgi:hypothetical protein
MTLLATVAMLLLAIAPGDAPQPDITIYAGPLEAGEDLLIVSIGDTVTVARSGT